MGKGIATGRRAASLVCAAVTGLVLLTGCGLPGLREPAVTVGAGGPTPHASSPVAKAPVPSGKPLDPDARVPAPVVEDENDATAVAKAWAEVTYGYDTAYDTSSYDAVLRSLRWCTERKSAAEKDFRPAAGPGHEWLTWASHDAWTTPKVTLETVDDAPDDTETIAHRSLVVDGTAHGRDGWTGPGPRLNAYVKLVRTSVGRPWRVDDVIVVEAVSPPEPEASSSASSASPDDLRQ
jgi:hypothetical protein